MSGLPSPLTSPTTGVPRPHEPQLLLGGSCLMRHSSAPVLPSSATISPSWRSMPSMRLVLTMTSGTASPVMSATSGVTSTSLAVHDHSSCTSILSKVGTTSHCSGSGCGRHFSSCGSQ